MFDNTLSTVTEEKQLINALKTGVIQRTITSDDWQWWHDLSQPWQHYFLSTKLSQCNTSTRTVTSDNIKQHQLTAILNTEGMKFYHDELEHLETLQPLTHLKYLRKLKFIGGYIADFDSIMALPSLTDLIFRDIRIGYIPTPITAMHHLNRLTLSGCIINDISALENLYSLKKLDLSRNQIKDITILGKLNHLTELNLTGNRIKNIDALTDLPTLTHLKLKHNHIKNVRPLANLPCIKTLDISGNFVIEKNMRWLQEQLPHVRLFV